MRAISVLTLLLLAACSGPTGAEVAPPCGLGGEAVLPITRLGLFVSVDATLDRAPARLVIDTGSQPTVLSAAAARRAGVALDPQRMLRATGIGGSASYPTARVGRLMLGNVAFNSPVVTILPQVPLADGNVGMDVLGDLDIDINLWAGRVSLYRGRLCPGQRPPWAAGATELRTEAHLAPLAPPTSRPRQLLLVMSLDGVPARAMFDSGAGRTSCRARSPPGWA